MKKGSHDTKGLTAVRRTFSHRKRIALTRRLLALRRVEFAGTAQIGVGAHLPTLPGLPICVDDISIEAARFGRSESGRPRRLPPIDNTAFANCSSVSSGASSYSCGATTCASTFRKSLPILRLLFRIAFPHRNDVPGVAPRSPYHHDHAPCDKARPASAKSRPRSVSVASRFAGSKVIFKYQMYPQQFAIKNFFGGTDLLVRSRGFRPCTRSSIDFIA